MVNPHLGTSQSQKLKISSDKILFYSFQYHKFGVIFEGYNLREGQTRKMEISCTTEERHLQVNRAKTHTLEPIHKVRWPNLHREP